MFKLKTIYISINIHFDKIEIFFIEYQKINIIIDVNFLKYILHSTMKNLISEILIILSHN
jgi:hypothetical protein